MTERNEAQEQAPSPRATRGQSSELTESRESLRVHAPQPPQPTSDTCAVIPDRAALLQDEIGTRDIGTISPLEVVEGSMERTVAEGVTREAPPCPCRARCYPEYIGAGLGHADRQTDRLTQAARIYWVSIQCRAPKQIAVPALVKLIYRKKQIANQEVKGKLQRESVP